MIKDYDRSQVRTIPKALERAGLGIYPIAPIKSSESKHIRLVQSDTAIQLNEPTSKNNAAVLKEVSEAGLWFHARKTRPIWVRRLEKDESVETLEGAECVPAGNYLCRGEAGDIWPQSEERLLSKYTITKEVDEQGWHKYNPKSDASGVMAAQVPHAFQVHAEWGQLSGKPGDFVVKNYGDRNIENPADVWIVDQALFQVTYERVQ